MTECFIHATADVSPKAKIGAGTKVWNQAQVREGAAIGKNCIIAKNVYVDFGVKIGDGTKVQNNACVYNPAVIEDGVFIGPGVILTNDIHPRAFIWDDRRRSKPTVVRKGASVGAGAILIGGVEIGEYAMVGAGAVVTENVPPHGLVVGVPAKLIGFVCKCGYRAKKREQKGSKIMIKCAECGEITKIPAGKPFKK